LIKNRISKILKTQFEVFKSHPVYGV
jgi:Ion transport protein